MFGRVLVGFDGSADAKAALRMAMSLAAAVGAEMAVVPVAPRWSGPAVLGADDNEDRR